MEVTNYLRSGMILQVPSWEGSHIPPPKDTFEDDDFPAFPFGGAWTRSLEGTVYEKLSKRVDIVDLPPIPAIPVPNKGLAWDFASLKIFHVILVVTGILGGVDPMYTNHERNYQRQHLR